VCSKSSNSSLPARVRHSCIWIFMIC
jgi:hypothetical protein